MPALPLIRLEVSAGCIAGNYRAVVDGSHVLHVRVPRAAAGLTAMLRGLPVDTSRVDELGLTLELDFTDGDHVPFEVRWKV